MRIRHTKQKIAIALAVLISTGALLTGCSTDNLSASSILGQNIAAWEQEHPEKQEGEQPSNSLQSFGQKAKDWFSNLFSQGKKKVEEFRDENAGKIGSIIQDKIEIKGSKETEGFRSADTGYPLKYEAEAFTVLSDTTSGFSREEIAKAASSYTYFSPLDALGRTGYGEGSFEKKNLFYDGRDDISDIHPAGWKQKEYSKELTGMDSEQLYNRCHILAESLCDNSSAQNLYTGTRQCNLAQLVFEMKVLRFLENHEGVHVLYRVTPLYERDNLICSSIMIQAESVEDGGKGLAFQGCCFNKEHGVVIDYATGDSKQEGQ